MLPLKKKNPQIEMRWQAKKGVTPQPERGGT